jgi:hypothetical protein
LTHRRKPNAALIEACKKRGGVATLEPLAAR